MIPDRLMGNFVDSFLMITFMSPPNLAPKSVCRTEGEPGLNSTYSALAHDSVSSDLQVCCSDWYGVD